MRKTNIMKATLFIISLENICCWLTALKLDCGIFWLFPVQLFWMTVAFGIASAETACVIVIRPTATDAWWLSPTVELLFYFTSYFSHLSLSLVHTNTRRVPNSVREAVLRTRVRRRRRLLHKSVFRSSCPPLLTNIYYSAPIATFWRLW